MKTFKKLLWLSAVFVLITSCGKEEMTDKTEIPEGKIPVKTEIIVDGVLQASTRASSDAGYTTGDGLYDEGDPVTVSAIANEGYELVSFYDKKAPSVNLGSSFKFPAEVPQTFKAEFARKYTISVSASPSDGGIVAGGGKYKGGSSCTVTATPNSGYAFDGWYEGITKVSSDASYTFTVSSNRTLTGRFKVKFIAVGRGGHIASSSGSKKVGEKDWYAVAYGNGKYVAVGLGGIITSSTNGVDWATQTIGSYGWDNVTYGNGKFVAVSWYGYITTSVDGTSWTTPKQIIDEDLYGIAFGNGYFIACGNNYIGKSTDGVNWTPVHSMLANCRDVAYGNGKFVITTSIFTGCVFVSSDNGNTWTSEMGMLGRDSRFLSSSIAFGNGVFVACTYLQTLTSEDGLTWSELLDVGSPYISSCAFCNSVFMLGYRNGTVSTSADGKFWTAPRQLNDELGNPINVEITALTGMP